VLAFSLLFADDALPSQSPWLLVIPLALLVASALVWAIWLRRDRTDRDFFGPRDPRSAQVRPSGLIVLLGFLSMFLVAAILGQEQESQARELPAAMSDIDKIAFQVNMYRFRVLADIVVLGMVLGFSYSQVQMTHGEQHPWVGIIPTGRDIRNGLLLAIACVPLMSVIQNFLQYLLIYVLEQPKVLHPSIELLLKNKDAEPALLDQLLIWVSLSVVVLAPITEEILFRGLLQGWLRTKYTAMTERMLAAARSAGDMAAGSSTAELQRRRITTWAPIFISALAFSIAHLGHGPAPIPLFFFALALGYVYEKTGRLAPVIIAHLLQNLFNTVLLWLMITGRIPAE
jgi:membrane protease YdiL (CAAX protease family)